MRDSILTLLVAATLPFALAHPYIGVLTWVWLSVMNPHRLTTGFAYNTPFAMVVAIVTMIGIIFTKVNAATHLIRSRWRCSCGCYG